jgi:predicted pyridoxine 5'-phosphate oxidase superfamily flavin-nucleotide-binding protein
VSLFVAFIGIAPQSIGMAQMTPEIMTALRAGRIFPLATASGNGEPNVAPMGGVFARDPETIWIGNQFMKTSIQNVLENPRACLYVWGPGITGCYKIKGDVKGEDERKRVRDDEGAGGKGKTRASLQVAPGDDGHGSL